MGKLDSLIETMALVLIVVARTCSLAFIYTLAWLALIHLLLPLQGWKSWFALFAGFAFVTVQTIDALRPLLENLRKLGKRFGSICQE